MEVLWSQPGSEMTGRQVADELPEYAYTTVATVLDRLSHKGMLQRRLLGRTARFAAARTRAGYAASLMLAALGAASDPDGTLAQFAESMSPAQAEVLRRALGESSRKA
jgi:BlaI family transcriptional regulator, penicillinase repressor